jgi:hypothetical protein
MNGRTSKNEEKKCGGKTPAGPEKSGRFLFAQEGA